MPWCASNLGLRPRRMDTVASTSGSRISTFWNRRSSALSASTCCLYSASGVAPTHRSSPRASAGFRRFDASRAPPEAPAPTTVWISSMNRMTRPSAASTSSMTALRRSSNSPRYLAPAISRPMSSRRSSGPGAPRHVAAHDALREALGDGGLADAGLADEAGVVLRPAAQDLDRPLDLVVAPDHGVQLARAGQLRQVATVLVERVRRGLRRPRVDRLVAPERVDRRPERRRRGDARGRERPAGVRRVQRQPQHLVRAVPVAEPATLRQGLLDDRLRPRAEARRGRRPGHGREARRLVLREPRQRPGIRRRLAQPQRAVQQPVAVLPQDRAQQVLGLDDAAAARLAACDAPCSASHAFSVNASGVISPPKGARVAAPPRAGRLPPPRQAGSRRAEGPDDGDHRDDEDGALW